MIFVKIGRGYVENISQYIYYTRNTTPSDMLPSYRTMKYKSPIWGYFHVQKE